jgi:hypothetical protein
MEGSLQTAVSRGNSGIVVGYFNCGMVFLQGDCYGVCVDINRGEIGDGCVEVEMGMVVEYCNCGMVFLPVKLNEGIVVVSV